jgi:peptidoglycan/LPS O-acetylase OafA/YrhL
VFFGAGASTSGVREHVRAGTEVVDGLRGLAIALVFAFHLWTFSLATPHAPFTVFVRAGYLGVELFFVISGFCLFFPYAQHALATGAKPTLGQFAYRRFIKIVPSYLVALLVTFAVALPYFIDKRTAWLPLAIHLAFVNNWFTDPIVELNSVFWSLGVEVQFYLIFPLLALAFVRSPVVALLATIAVGLGYRYGFGAYLVREPVVRQVPAYLDVFGFGMFAAYAVVFLRTRMRVPKGELVFTALALVAVAAIVALLTSANAVFFAPQGPLRWNLPNRTLLGASFALLIVASCLAAAWWRALVANPVLVFLSLVSYNLYLWHTLVMKVLTIRGMRPLTYDVPGADDAWKLPFIVASIVASLVVATALTYFVERPLLATVRPQRFAFRLRRRP